MLRISRFALGLLLLNLTLVGQELACAHEAQATEIPASTDHHGGVPSHHEQDVPSSPQEEPCEEPGAQCCDAIASCSVAGVPRQALSRAARPHAERGLIAAAESHLASTPVEVATPPPRA